MIDKRLIDYSNHYKDNKETLEEKSKLFAFDDMMNIIEGSIANYRVDTLNDKERELLMNLDKLHGSYRNS